MLKMNDASLSFGREIACRIDHSDEREWLVTNSLGSYASGTVSDALTRRYHGLLVAALKPPLGRTLLVAKFDASVNYDGISYPLSTNRWASQSVDPTGYLNIQHFALDGSIPVWTYAFADAILEKRIWMEPHTNQTYVHFRTIRSSKPIEINVKAIVNYRNFHGTTHSGNWKMDVSALPNGIKVLAFEDAVPYYIFCDKEHAVIENTWYKDYFLTQENYRGLDCTEDHLCAGSFLASLQHNDTLTFVCTTTPVDRVDGNAALLRRHTYEQQLIAQAPLPAGSTPPWIQQLILSADQFVVDRQAKNIPHGKTIIAGYHWFGDWGRDTMISLPGLTLTTGRAPIAKAILQTFALYVDQGMLPNRFPDEGQKPEYNTVDATLWYFEAIRSYLESTNDRQFLEEIFPILNDIIDWHKKGTRYNIHVDASDGLLYAGENGVQLTWMDAKIGNWVITPRIGKPIEVNALWYNALKTMGKFAKLLDNPASDYEESAQKVQTGFSKFWIEGKSHCFDVIDGPNGNDASLRPNQIFAVSLPESPLNHTQQRQVVDICGRKLLTSYGLRSLDPDDPNYHGHYGGNQFQRDSVYHQGTVWGWLLGPFSLAHYRVYNNAAQALSIIKPMSDHLQNAGLGTASEIFDGDAPIYPRGCIAQAWTVAELLRTWQTLSQIK